MSAVLKPAVQQLTITKVKPHIGAIVTGVDLAQPIDEATRNEVLAILWSMRTEVVRV